MGKKTKGFQGPTNKVWDSELEFAKPKVWVAKSVLTISDTIQDKVGNKEFSILLKGHWQKEGFIVVDEYYIPKQEVDGTSVDYKEDLSKLREDKGWNTIVHSHPFNSDNFSVSDDESINIHFECSILYSKGAFTRAVVNVPKDKLTVQLDILKAKIKTFDLTTVEVDGLEKINTKSAWTHGSYYKGSTDSYWGNTDREYDRELGFWKETDKKGEVTYSVWNKSRGCWEKGLSLGEASAMSS